MYDLFGITDHAVPGAMEHTHLKGTMYEIYHSEHDDQCVLTQ